MERCLASTFELRCEFRRWFCALEPVSAAVAHLGSLGIIARAMKFLPHVVWVIGVVLLLVAFGRYSGASMPYQDPTPELLAVRRGQIESAKTAALIGGLIFIAGIGWVIIRPRSRSVSVTI